MENDKAKNIDALKSVMSSIVDSFDNERRETFEYGDFKSELQHGENAFLRRVELEVETVILTATLAYEDHTGKSISKSQYELLKDIVRRVKIYEDEAQAAGHTCIVDIAFNRLTKEFKDSV